MGDALSINHHHIGAIMDKPSTLEEIYEQRHFWSKRADRARERQAAAAKTIEQCSNHLGISVMVDQLADLLAPHFPDHKLEVLGPFGLAHETSIHARAFDTASGRFHTVGSLNLRPYDDDDDCRTRLRRIDWSRNTGQFPAGSFGARNQLNYPDVDLPPTIEEIAMLLGADIAEGVK